MSCLEKILPRLRVSKGNTKLGKRETMNINLPPPATCAKMPCLNSGCYAMKSYRIYPNVREAWNANYELYLGDPVAYFAQVHNHLAETMPKYFRWHSGGEIPDQRYFDGMVQVAAAFPKTAFLVFTKKYGLDVSKAPENLNVIFSVWPGLKLPKRARDAGFVAWVDDGSEAEKARIKADGKKPFQCTLHCETCRVCWKINKVKRDIVFHKH